MKVLILKDGETAEVNDSYGARLIEQGRAVVIPSKAAKQRTEQPEPAPEAETPAEEAPATKPTKRKK